MGTEPRAVSYEVRAACEVFGQVFSLQLGALEQAERYEYRLKLAGLQESLVNAMARAPRLTGELTKCLPDLMEYIPSDGVALSIDGEVAMRGRTPSADQIAGLCRWLAGQKVTDVFFTDSLAGQWPDARSHANTASGVLALAVPSGFVLWFRPEIVETVEWAGDPKKPALANQDSERLSPRRSFELWREQVRFHSKPWSEAEIQGARALRVSMLEVIYRRLEEAERERQQAQERQHLLMAELEHRVKNTLANVHALVTMSKSHARSLEDFTAGLERRLAAMAYTHSLLTESRWEGASIRAIVQEELRVFLEEGSPRVRIKGAAFLVKPKAAMVLSLVIHELTTNAGKYGALSEPSGSLEVSWELRQREGDRRVCLTWKESGGPSVGPPKSRGFGTTMIERVVGFELEGHASLEFRPAGVVCQLEIPSEVLAAAPDRSPASNPGYSAARRRPSNS